MAKRLKQPTSGLTRKQISRAKREARTQRWILIGAGVIAAVVVGVLIFAVVNEQVITPRRAVARVNGDTITVTQFRERVKFEDYLQLSGQPLSLFGIDSTYFAQLVLDSMVQEILIRQKAQEMGITVSDAEVEERMQLNFGYDAGTPEPTSTPTATQALPIGTPTATSTFVYTLTPSPTSTLAAGVTPSATPTATPTPGGTATITPTPSPWPTPTPLTETAYNEKLTQFVGEISQATGLTTERVKELWYEDVRTSLLQQKLVEALNIQADEKKTMIHAAHILVATEEEAKAVLDRIAAGEEFEKLAAELSTDSSNAYKGGDLGWFGPGQMDATFENAALNVPVGEVSNPVQTAYGWHVIKVYARTDVPMTAQEQERQRRDKFNEFVGQWRDEGDVVIEDIWMNYVPELP